MGAWINLSTTSQATLIQNRKGRVLGHTQANRNFGYVNANAETVRPAAAARVADLISVRRLKLYQKTRNHHETSRRLRSRFVVLELGPLLAKKKASLNGWLFLPYVLLWLFVANNTSSF